MTTAAETKARRLVRSRANGWCETGCGQTGSQFHHRDPRWKGPWSASNGLWVCLWCHDWIELNRTDAKRHGWLLTTGDIPCEVPCETGRGWLCFADDGGVREASPEEVVALTAQVDLAATVKAIPKAGREWRVELSDGPCQGQVVRVVHQRGGNNYPSELLVCRPVPDTVPPSAPGPYFAYRFDSGAYRYSPQKGGPDTARVEATGSPTRSLSEEREDITP